MKKKISIILVILIVLFMGIDNVKAASCASINTEISNYNAIEKKLSNYDCSKDTDSKIVKSCNKLNLQKSNSITKLYRLKVSNPKCKNEIKKIDKIISRNSANCTKISDGLLESFTSKVLLVFYILGPILVILFSSIDYTKAIMSNDQNALKKTSINFVKRLASLIILFMIPALINIFTGLSNSEYVLNGDGYVCKSDFIVLKKTHSITYIPSLEDADSTLGGYGGGSSNATTGRGSGNFLNWRQCGSPWSNKTLGSSSSSVCKSGCLVTSVAIQIANSGAAKNGSSFNPGVLVDTLNRHGGFSGANFTWTGWQTLAPNFQSYNSSASISGTQTQKAKQLATYINKGFYPVVEVKKCIGRQHWVAVVAVKGTKVIMADPASNGTNLSDYSCFKNSGTQRVALFKTK